MKRTISLIAAAATLAAAGAAHALTAAQTVDIIAHNGYYAPHDLELTAGVWHAKVTAPNGKRIYVLVDNASGKLDVIDPAKLRNGQGLASAAQVMQVLKNAGWAVVQDLEFDDGLWEAEVRRAKGQPKYEVYVHPITLAILNGNGSAISGGGTATSALSAQQIVQALQNAGYTNIHDVEFDDDGYWEADATNASGQCVDLDINPTTGAVMREQLDRDGCSAGSNTGSTNKPSTTTTTSNTNKPTTTTNTSNTNKPTNTTATGGKLTAAHITQLLQQAGYTNIHDLEYDRDDGYWEADARNARGQKVELHINPITGKVIREKRD